ncbi:MAG: 1-deoxy-D-xylulose-5-phosphate synthase [Oscillospiraceae bacterium]|nr:1-deoxy-D-xylulose-5-phosphate synthase [Oscillospiraceae bacterium]
MGILSQIHSPDDVKKLSMEELELLAAEIRDFLIENISKTGGHLASNLGIVEMTIALHKVFDTSKDRLVFDVGHQSYVHKIITGRKDEFPSLRKSGGISGFLKPSESIHDACITGHASNSVSVALGMARARTLCEEKYSVISVTGDGALTGGMAYEGLSDAGQSGEPMIIILNDNEMSIAKNVGAMTAYLAKLRLKRKYLRFKRGYHKIMRRTKVGRFFDKGIHGVKNAFKSAFLPSSFFEDMGFAYLGPADGHDIEYMTYLFKLARDMKRPVVIHLITKKGKGYEHSEAHPQEYHGVGSFDIREGVSSPCGINSFSAAFGDELLKIAEENERVCAITAAMTSGVGLEQFSENFPKRFFDVAIAEEHAVAMSAGLAARGMIPVCAVYSTFLQRAYDMIIHDVAISGQHVVFAVDRAGIVGEDGETHHGAFDVSFLADVPNMRIFAPANFLEVRSMLRTAIDENGPVAIRYPRGKEGTFKNDAFIPGNGCSVLSEGADLTIVAYGMLINNVLEAATFAKKDGIECEILKLNIIKPLDESVIIESAKKTGRIMVVEDVINHGSVAEAISSMLLKNGIKAELIAINAGDSFVTHGDKETLYKMLKIDSENVYKAIVEACKK